MKENKKIFIFSDETTKPFCVVKGFYIFPVRFEEPWHSSNLGKDERNPPVFTVSVTLRYFFLLFVNFSRYSHNYLTKCSLPNFIVAAKIANSI